MCSISTAGLSDAQDRLKILEQELAQARRASSGSEPPSGSKRSNQSVEQGSDVEPAGKRSGLPSKTTLPTFLTFSPPADNRTLSQKALDPQLMPKKVLRTDCPPTASSQATTKWMQTLKLSDDLKTHLQQACANACNTAQPLSEEDNVLKIVTRARALAS